MISVENLNKTYPKYPITVQDKGWVYGLWYCPTDLVGTFRELEDLKHLMLDRYLAVADKGCDGMRGSRPAQERVEV